MTKLIFMCGKMAAGKSALARQLAERELQTPPLSEGFTVIHHRRG